MNKAIFLDRDGTLNEDTIYPHKIEDYELLPGVIDGLQKLRDAGYLFIIVTNQSGIGRGIFTEDQFHEFNDHLLKELKESGIEIKKTYYSKSHPDEPDKYRKPNPAAIEEAEKEFDIDIKQSWVLGDHASDIALGKNAGVKTIHLLTGHGYQEKEQAKVKELGPDYVAKNFLDATKFILNNS